MMPGTGKNSSPRGREIAVPLAFTGLPENTLMSNANEETEQSPREFDFSRYPANALIHERRRIRDRRGESPPASTPEAGKSASFPAERRSKPERRRRIDPTTFEKQYTDDELEFMNAMQRFKEASGTSFPTHGEVLRVAIGLGYRRVIEGPERFDDDSDTAAPA